MAGLSMQELALPALILPQLPVYQLTQAFLKLALTAIQPYRVFLQFQECACLVLIFASAARSMAMEHATPMVAR